MHILKHTFIPTYVYTLYNIHIYLVIHTRTHSHTHIHSGVARVCAPWGGP